ncbi:apolipoprotein N-acyltransferase [Prosthecomicrobium sp. N25]|uniref:apolipoprotein N-acyltransferase n=1 Tax=Prosthecomicrobium sp. N25 TaxID=3129254 RepID=UPI003077824C
MIERLADAVLLAWGWRRAAIGMGAGALAALAQAPLHLFPVLWVSLPVLVLLLDGAVAPGPDGTVIRPWRSFFAVGWLFGFGYFLAGLWWVGAAFTVDLAQFGWLLPIALAALSGGLALFMGLGAILARAGWRDGPARILALACGLALSEWLRGHVLTGFPWNALGYGLAADDRLMQAASLVGIEGMTPLAVLIFASPTALFGPGRGRRAAALGGLAVLAGIYGFGAWRLSGADAAGFEPGVRLRIMQPAVDQWRKWKPEFRAEILNRYVELSAGPDGRGLNGVTHLIWPESAFPFFLAHEAWALSTIADLLPPGTTLLTGAIRAEPPSAGETRPRVYNSVFAVRDDAEILAAYDKVHLVPFGEYLPWQDTLESLGLRQLTHLRGGFSAGPKLRTLRIPGTPPLSALVCYEAIFPSAAIDPADRPSWLLNVTNDGWFGITPGPYQHLHQARLRAVEEGLPLVRAANSGVSAVIDAFGRVQTKLPLGESGVIDAGLPRSIAAPFYTAWRHFHLWVVIAGMLFLGLTAPRKFSRYALIDATICDQP